MAVRISVRGEQARKEDAGEATRRGFALPSGVARAAPGPRRAPAHRIGISRCGAGSPGSCHPGAARPPCAGCAFPRPRQRRQQRCRRSCGRRPPHRRAVGTGAEQGRRAGGRCGRQDPDRAGAEHQAPARPHGPGAAQPRPLIPRAERREALLRIIGQVPRRAPAEGPVAAGGPIPRRAQRTGARRAGLRRPSCPSPNATAGRAVLHPHPPRCASPCPSMEPAVGRHAVAHRGFRENDRGRRPDQVRSPSPAVP